MLRWRMGHHRLSVLRRSSRHGQKYLSMPDEVLIVFVDPVRRGSCLGGGQAES